MVPLDQDLSSPWPFSDSTSLQGYEFELPPPPPPKGRSQSQYLHQSVHRDPNSLEHEVETAVYRLLSLDLNPRQIRELRKPEYREAVLCIADRHEDDIDRAICSKPSQGQSHCLPNSSRMTISSQASIQYPSGVPSLIPDRGSVATNFSLPRPDSFNSGLAYVPETGMLQRNSTWAATLDEFQFQGDRDFVPSMSSGPESGFPAQKVDVSVQRTHPQSVAQIGISTHHQPIPIDTSARSKGIASHAFRLINREKIR